MTTTTSTDAGSVQPIPDVIIPEPPVTHVPSPPTEVPLSNALSETLDAARREVVADPVFVRPKSVARRVQKARPVRKKRTAKAPKKEEAPLGPMPAGPLGVIDELLRDRLTLLRRIEEGQQLATIARAMLVTIIICSAALGASLGFYRGGIQVLYAALKLPIVVLMTAVICAPVYSALKSALGHRVSVVADFALILSALALASIMTVSLAPLLLLAALQPIDYHPFILLVVGLCGLGGAVGYTFFFKGMHRDIREHTFVSHRLVGITLLITLGLVSTQMVWFMRPYVVRPQSTEIPFVRSSEGSFINAVICTYESARGNYRDCTTP